MYKTGRVLWADTLDAPAHNMIELREKIVARTQGVLAAALGGSAYTVKGTRPTNNEAYELYLRALSMPQDSGTNQQTLAMLERSVALDPNFAPAWLRSAGDTMSKCAMGRVAATGRTLHVGGSTRGCAGS